MTDDTLDAWLRPDARELELVEELVAQFRADVAALDAWQLADDRERADRLTRLYAGPEPSP